MATMLKYEDKDLKVVGTRPIRPDGVDKVTAAPATAPTSTCRASLRSRGPKPARPCAGARHPHRQGGGAQGRQGRRHPRRFPGMPIEYAAAGELIVNFRDVTRNMMAREKVLYDGHPVAAVAATSDAVARQAVKLIEVDYEVLPHVIDPVEALAEDAPLLHEEQITEGVDPAPEKPSNLAKVFSFAKGDVEKGFAEADLVIEREFNTKPVHQGLYRAAGLARELHRGRPGRGLHRDPGPFRDPGAVRQAAADGHFQDPRNPDRAWRRVRRQEQRLSRTARHRSLQEVQPAGQDDDEPRGRVPRHRATSGAHTRIKIGCRKDGRIVAAEAQLDFQAGAFAGSSVPMASMCTFTRYDLENVKVTGNDITVNRPKVAAYRAPGAPISIFGVESILDEMSRELGIDPIELRLRNAAKEGTQTYYGPTFGPIGYEDTLKRAVEHPHLKEPLGPDQGRGIATGFWFNIGKETTTTLNVNEDGTVAVILGTIDVAGGSPGGDGDDGRGRARHRRRQGAPADRRHPAARLQLRDRRQPRHLRERHGGDGRRAQGDRRHARARRPDLDVPVDGVVWEDGHARPASSNVGEFEPLSIADIARKSGMTGGPIAGHAEITAEGAGPGFGTHIVDVEVDRRTGLVKILRYTVIQDTGKAIHPAYVEGQFQGGAVQGIGWALNEEYIYDENGTLQNPGFLDYRVPVASDVPFIGTEIVEVPNPNHPYGVRGIGEVPIIPPIAAISNAIHDAIGIRLREQPMSPPKVLKAIRGGRERRRRIVGRQRPPSILALSRLLGMRSFRFPAA